MLVLLVDKSENWVHFAIFVEYKRERLKPRLYILLIKMEIESGLQYLQNIREKEKKPQKKTEEQQKKAEMVVKEVLKAIQKAKAEVPHVDSTVTVR